MRPGTQKAVYTSDISSQPAVQLQKKTPLAGVTMQAAMFIKPEMSSGLPTGSATLVREAASGFGSPRAMSASSSRTLKRRRRARAPAAKVPRIPSYETTYRRDSGVPMPFTASFIAAP